jgi:hypothetical protein
MPETKTVKSKYRFMIVPWNEMGGLYTVGIRREVDGGK